MDSSVGLGSVKGTTGSVLWPWVALAALLEESVPQVPWLWVPRVPRLGQSVPRVPWVRQWAPPLRWLKKWFCELSSCLREWVSKLPEWVSWGRELASSVPLVYSSLSAILCCAPSTKTKRPAGTVDAERAPKSARVQVQAKEKVDRQQRAQRRRRTHSRDNAKHSLGVMCGSIESFQAPKVMVEGCSDVLNELNRPWLPLQLLVLNSNREGREGLLE